MAKGVAGRLLEKTKELKRGFTPNKGRETPKVEAAPLAEVPSIERSSSLGFKEIFTIVLIILGFSIVSFTFGLAISRQLTLKEIENKGVHGSATEEVSQKEHELKEAEHHPEQEHVKENHSDHKPAAAHGEDHHAETKATEHKAVSPAADHKETSGHEKKEETASADTSHGQEKTHVDAHASAQAKPNEAEKTTVKKMNVREFEDVERKAFKEIYNSSPQSLKKAAKDLTAAERKLFEGLEERKIASRSPTEHASAAVAATTSGLQRGGYTLQVGAYPTEQEAAEKVRSLKAKGYKDAKFEEAEIPEKGTWYRIYVGKFNSTKDAEKLAQDLKASGIVTTSFVKPLDSTH